MKGNVLTIAGTDPSGGAGIQADIKTITAFKGFATSVITALVAQNTMGVKSISEVPVHFIEEQIDCVFDDIKIDSIKLGMLHQPEIVELVSKKIKDYNLNVPVVLDPVMVAKSGDILLTESAILSLKTNILPIAYIVTPNIPEAEIISGTKIVTDDDVLKAGEIILSMGPNSVLMKGGHREGEAVYDFIICSGGYKKFESERINTVNTHGTGCTLSAAIASKLAQGEDLISSIQIARDYVHNAILTAPKIGKGNGPLNHVHFWE